jgi:hypothetical protein
MVIKNEIKFTISTIFMYVNFNTDDCYRYDYFIKHFLL